MVYNRLSIIIYFYILSHTMKKSSALLLCAALLVALCCFSCKSENNTQNYPMFWTWLEDLPDVDMEEAFANMEEAGIEAVMLHAASVED